MMKPSREMIEAGVALFDELKDVISASGLVERIYQAMREVEFEQDKLACIEFISAKMVGK